MAFKHASVVLFTLYPEDCVSLFRVYCHMLFIFINLIFVHVDSLPVFEDEISAWNKSKVVLGLNK